jgi:hypothetical protein
MQEHHVLMGGKLHVYRRKNSGQWQCSTYLAGKNWRKSTKEESVTLAKELAQDWCGHEPGQGVNQQSEINVCHGFFLVFVSLHWRDVSEAKAGIQQNGKGRAAPGTRGVSAQAPARKKAALNAMRHRLDMVNGHDKGGRREKT